MRGRIGEPGDDDFAEPRAQVLTHRWVRDRLPEEIAEGVLARDPEDAVRADHEVDIDGFDVTAELAGHSPAFEDPFEQVNRRPTGLPRRFQLPNEAAAVRGLERNETDEGLVLDVVIERICHTASRGESPPPSVVRATERMPRYASSRTAR